MEPPRATPFKVALINNSEDILEILRAFLRAEGIQSITVHLAAIKDGDINITQFLAEQDPQVVLWDIPPPYDANWEYFQRVQHLPEAQGRQFVLTTTNRAQLQALAGADVAAIEVVGKPFDLEEIRQAIRQAGREMSADEG